MTLDARGRRVLRAAWFIEERLFEHLHAHDVSAAVGGSTSELQRMFKAEYGVSLMAYQRQRRLCVASSMLGSHAVGEVAQRCGYGSSAAFVRAFKKRYGVSPGRFRAESVEAFFGTEPADQTRLEHRRRLDRSPSRRVLEADQRLHGIWSGIRAGSEDGFDRAMRDVRPSVPVGAWVTGVLSVRERGLVLFLGTPEARLEETYDLMAGAYAVFHHQGALEMVRETVSFWVQPWRTILELDEARVPFERFRMPAPEATTLELEMWLPTR